MPGTLGATLVVARAGTRTASFAREGDHNGRPHKR